MKETEPTQADPEEISFAKAAADMLAPFDYVQVFEAGLPATKQITVQLSLHCVDCYCLLVVASKLRAGMQALECIECGRKYIVEAMKNKVGDHYTFCLSALATEESTKAGEPVCCDVIPQSFLDSTRQALKERGF